MAQRGAKASIDALKAANIGLIILDECHHLTEHWGQVLAALREELNHPVVLGLTATPPDEEKAGVEHYTALLGDIDYEVPTPALVRDSNLAPYQDLAYFVRPTAKELAYIAEADESFLKVVEDISQPFEGEGRALCFPDWLSDTLEHRRIPGRDDLSYAERFTRHSLRSRCGPCLLELQGPWLTCRRSNIGDWLWVNSQNDAAGAVVATVA